MFHDNGGSEYNYEKLYNELIYAVGKVFPGESRHETALRYIRKAEQDEYVPAKEQKVKTRSSPVIVSTNKGGWAVYWSVRDIIFGSNKKEK